MEKVILILTCLFLIIVLCGCTNTQEKAYQSLTESDRQYRLVCIDGIEYIMFGIGYRVMSPHLAADKFDNPKVIRCKR